MKNRAINFSNFIAASVGIILLALTLLVLTGCGTVRDGTNSHLIISCADGAGISKMVGLGGKTAKLTHSDPEHQFTDNEIQLLREQCPPEFSQDAIINALLRSQS